MKNSVKKARAGLIPESDWLRKEKKLSEKEKKKKNSKERIVWASNEVDRILDHLSPALLHKLVDERSIQHNPKLISPRNPLVVFVEGGIVQTILRVDSSTRKGYRFMDYELVDYDVFKTSDNQEIKDIWEGFSEELQVYFQKHLPTEYAKFQERIAELCTCADRSWFGKEHDSACPLAGQPNPNSLVKR